MDALGARARRWIGLVREYLLWQVVSRGAAFVAAFTLLRVLSVRDYALYALAISGANLLATLIDLGTTNTLLFFRRKAHDGNRPFEVYVRATRRLNRLLFAVCAVPFLVGYGRLAHSHGYPTLQSMGAFLMGLALA